MISACFLTARIVSMQLSTSLPHCLPLLITVRNCASYISASYIGHILCNNKSGMMLDLSALDPPTLHSLPSRVEPHLYAAPSVQLPTVANISPRIGKGRCRCFLLENCVIENFFTQLFDVCFVAYLDIMALFARCTNKSYYIELF